MSGRTGQMTREQSAQWHLVRLLATLDSVHRFRGARPAGFEQALAKLKKQATQARISLRRTGRADRLTLDAYRYKVCAEKRLELNKSIGLNVSAMLKRHPRLTTLNGDSSV